MRRRVARLKCEEHVRLFHSLLLLVFFSQPFFIYFDVVVPTVEICSIRSFVTLRRMQIRHLYNSYTRRYNIQNVYRIYRIVAVSAVFVRVFFSYPPPSFSNVIQPIDKSLAIFKNSDEFLRLVGNVDMNTWSQKVDSTV